MLVLAFVPNHIGQQSLKESTLFADQPLVGTRADGKLWPPESISE
jgi:hypothetical protein